MNIELNHLPNFERLVLGCMDSYDSESRRVFQHFSRSTVAPIGRKISASTFLLQKKRIFGEEGGRSNLSTG